MYQFGQIRPEVERFAMDQALEAYRRLEAGELSERASSSRTVDRGRLSWRRARNRFISGSSRTVAP